MTDSSFGLKPSLFFSRWSVCEMVVKTIIQRNKWRVKRCRIDQNDPIGLGVWRRVMNVFKKESRPLHGMSSYKLQPHSQPSIRVCLPSPPPMIPSAARMIRLRQTTVGAGSEAAARQRSEVMDRSNRGGHNRGRAHKLHAEERDARGEKEGHQKQHAPNAAAGRP